MRTATLAPSHAAPESAQKRLRLSLALVGLIWAAGLIGHFTPLAEWPALFIYVIGALALALYYCRSHSAWQEVGLTRHNLGRALAWGIGVGALLMLSDLGNTYIYYRSGGAPMAQMEAILVGMRLLYLFPVLVLAEEFLWRGMLFSALRDRGMQAWQVIGITTLLYMLNHYAVAPVGMLERTLMVAMALPIGLIGGYLTWRTRNVWGAVAVHGMTFISMIADIFIMPAIARG